MSKKTAGMSMSGMLRPDQRATASERTPSQRSTPEATQYAAKRIQSLLTQPGFSSTTPISRVSAKNAETPTKRKRLKSRAVRVRSVANATAKASAVMPPHVRHPGELVKVSHQRADECMDRLPRTSTQLQNSTLGVACFRARSKPRR
jgi:hypothetical protein